MEQDKRPQDKSGIDVQPNRETAAASVGTDEMRNPSGDASTRDEHQPSALGGDVATRSSTREGPDPAEEEQAD